MIKTVEAGLGYKAIHLSASTVVTLAVGDINTFTGAEKPVAFKLSVAEAVSFTTPSCSVDQLYEYGASESMPTSRSFAKKETNFIVPSVSVALAVTSIMSPG